MLGGSSITDVDNYPNRAGQTGNKAMTIPLDTTGGPKEGAQRAKRVESMQKRLEAKLAQNQRIARLSRQVRMVDTAQGIRIDLVDDADFSMFQLGTTVLTGDAAELLRVLGQVVSGEPGELTVRGHTDALPWKGGLGANNWSLSAGRAEATRQAGEINASLQFGRMSDIFSTGLHEYLTDFLSATDKLGDEINRSFFAPELQIET